MSRPTAILLAFLFLFTGIADASTLSRDTGKPTLAISSRVNSAGFGKILERDQARARFLRENSLRHTGTEEFDVNVTEAIFYYTADVGIGTPPTHYTLVIDTGSSNTWVGANHPYVVTKSSVNTNNSVHVSYGSGELSGEEWLDNVTLAPDLKIARQSIGVANLTGGMGGASVDGILGLGPVDLTVGTVKNTARVPTVADNLYAQGKISQEVLGAFFAPVSESDGRGTLTFGGYDPLTITSLINYVPLTTTDPAAMYWGIDQSILYGDTRILTSTAGVVDAGSTLILISSDAFLQYTKLTGATLDPETGLLTISTARYSELQTLWFRIGGVSYGLTRNAQIWPRSLNTAIGGRSDRIYLIVNDIGSPLGSGLDFINGLTFLQRFYTVYDTTRRHFGIAETIYTNSDSN